MELLYVSCWSFDETPEGIYALPSCSDEFLGKYIGVFDSVRVLGEKFRNYLDKSALVKLENPNISIRILPPNKHPKEIKNDRVIKKILTEEIKKAEAILIKPATRKGMMAVKIAEKLKKPYIIEMTGDVHNALRQHPSVIKRMYAPIIYRQVKNAIKNCEYGIYVSRDYLQGEFPIKGKMCGCSDVVLEKSDPIVLEKRLEKIENMKKDDIINLSLIGFYQGNMKGVDTALRAMARLPENFHLSVLGNGVEASRLKWYEYGEARGVKRERLHFPKALPSAQAVLHWLDDYDFFVFPTRSEGFGRVVAEAMSRGVPCFATNICTMPELLPSKCLFELDDDKELARLIMEYCGNKELMKEAARVNFEKVKEYDAELLENRRNAFLREFKEYCIKMNEVG